MSRLELCITGLPSSNNNIAAINLMLSVTNANGRPCSGLRRENFTVHWIVDNLIDSPLASVTVTEYKGGSVPNLPGVYSIDIHTVNDHWSPTSANRTVLFVAVKAGNKRGQTLHEVTDPSIALPR